MKHPLLISKGSKPRTGYIVKCANCGEEIYLRPSAVRTHNFCSVKCHNKYQIKGEPLICKVCGNEYYRPPAQVKWRGSSFCGNKCRHLHQRTLKGEKSPSWEGGKSSIYRRLRSSVDFAEWRESVFTRDNWTCRDCGARSMKGKKVKLHPHHINSFTHFPELRFEVSNGLTLCEDCHRRHTSWQDLNGRRHKKAK